MNSFIKTVIISLFIACTFSAFASGNKEFHVAEYGAVGDGITDDGQAIRDAIDAAIEAGEGAKVIFEEKTYRLAKYDGSRYHFNFKGVEGITIEGNGAEIINNPYNSIFSINESKDITLRGFEFDCFPLPFTQGTITSVDTDNGKFYLHIHEGYENPVKAYREIGKKPNWGWGVCIDSQERERKPGAIMHMFIQDVTEVDVDKKIICVELTDEYKKHISELAEDDRFVITIKYGPNGSNIAVSKSEDIHLEDYSIYTAKYGMVHSFSYNTGRIYVDGVNITFKPGTDRLITTPKDGFHCKHNSIGPIIEDGLFEGLLDDAINISVCPYWIKKDLGNNQYLIVRDGAKIGDKLMAYTPSTGAVIEDIEVLQIDPQASPKGKRDAWSIITLSKPVPNVGLHQGDNYFPGGTDKMVFTGLYNVSQSGKDYIVRNNTFREQRRYGVLARASGGLIEGNSFIGVGGCGIYLTNEEGSFYEGPFPANTTIRDNTFINTTWNSVRVTTKGRNVYAKNIKVVDNYFSGWSTTLPGKSKAAAIDLSNIAGGLIKGNTIHYGKAPSNISTPILLRNTKDVVQEENIISSH